MLINKFYKNYTLLSFNQQFLHHWSHIRPMTNVFNSPTKQKGVCHFWWIQFWDFLVQILLKNRTLYSGLYSDTQQQNQSWNEFSQFILPLCVDWHWACRLNFERLPWSTKRRWKAHSLKHHHHFLLYRRKAPSHSI